MPFRNRGAAFAIVCLVALVVPALRAVSQDIVFDGIAEGSMRLVERDGFVARLGPLAAQFSFCNFGRH